MRKTARALAAPLFALLLPATAAIPQAAAPTVLDAADNAELRTEVAQNGPVRVALLGDRIGRVVQAPGGWTVEHDPDAGDIYLRRPAPHPQPAQPAGPVGPAGIFIGSERGFTYRLELLPVLGGASQVLIRNPAAGIAKDPVSATAGESRVAEIAGLIRAVANRQPLPGYSVARVADQPGGMPGSPPILANGVGFPADAALLEIWRGARFEAIAVALGPDGASIDAAGLAGRFGPGVLAAWIDDVGTPGARLAVVAREVAADVGR